ncbi:MAG: hypothetical protein AAF580_16460, partial [Pseudomonadota bacterium]
RRVDGMDKYASTVADIMTEMGLDGWDFIGAEALRERRRRMFVLICDVERTLMIFRRKAVVESLVDDSEAKANAPEATAEPVTPRRVRRPELIADVAAGKRRITVNAELAAEATADAAIEGAAAAPPQKDGAETEANGDRGDSWIARAVTKAKTAEKAAAEPKAGPKAEPKAKAETKKAPSKAKAAPDVATDVAAE